MQLADKTRCASQYRIKSGKPSTRHINYEYTSRPRVGGSAMTESQTQPAEPATKIKGITVLVAEILVSLVLNLTASAYPDQLNPLIRFGWLAIALQTTYPILPSGILTRWVRQPTKRVLRLCALFCIVVGLIWVYWTIITTTLRKLETSKQ